MGTRSYRSNDVRVGSNGAVELTISPSWVGPSFAARSLHCASQHVLTEEITKIGFERDLYWGDFWVACVVGG